MKVKCLEVQDTGPICKFDFIEFASYAGLNC